MRRRSPSRAPPHSPLRSAGVPVTCTITPTPFTGGSADFECHASIGATAPASSRSATCTGATTVSHTYRVRARTPSRRPRPIRTVSAARGRRRLSSRGVRRRSRLPGRRRDRPVCRSRFSVAPPANPTPPITNVTVDFGDGTSRNLGASRARRRFTKTYCVRGHVHGDGDGHRPERQRGSSSSADRHQPCASSDDYVHAIRATPGRREPASERSACRRRRPRAWSIQSIVVTRTDGEALYQRQRRGTFAVDVTRQRGRCRASRDRLERQSDRNASSW